MRLSLNLLVHTIGTLKGQYLLEIAKEIKRTETEIAIQASETQITELRESPSADAADKIATLEKEIRTLQHTGLKCPLFDFYVLAEPIGSIHPLTDDEKNHFVFNLVEYKTQLISVRDLLSTLSVYEHPLLTADVVLELWRITGHDVNLHVSSNNYFKQMNAILQFRENTSDNFSFKKMLKFTQLFPHANFENLHNTLKAVIEDRLKSLPFITAEREMIAELSFNSRKIDVTKTEGCYALLTQVCALADKGEDLSTLVNHVISNNDERALTTVALNYAQPVFIAMTRAIINDTPIDMQDQNTIFLIGLVLEGFSLTKLQRALLAHIQREHEYYQALEVCNPNASRDKIALLNAIKLAVESIAIGMDLPDARKNREMLMQFALYYCDPSRIYARSSSSTHIIFSQTTPPTLENALSTVEKIKKGFQQNTGCVEATLSQQREGRALTTEDPPKRQTLFQMRRSASTLNSNNADEQRKTQPYNLTPL